MRATKESTSYGCKFVTLKIVLNYFTSLHFGLFQARIAGKRCTLYYGCNSSLFPITTTGATPTCPIPLLLQQARHLLVPFPYYYNRRDTYLSHSPITTTGAAPTRPIPLLLQQPRHLLAPFLHHNDRRGQITSQLAGAAVETEFLLDLLKSKSIKPFLSAMS